MYVCVFVCVYAMHTIKAMLVGGSQEVCNPHTTKWKVAALPSLLVDRSLHQPVTLLLQILSTAQTYQPSFSLIAFPELEPICTLLARFILAVMLAFGIC